MRTKSGVDIGPSPGPTSNVIRALLGDLTVQELERLATTVIREHRRRLQRAQDLFEEIGRLESVGGDDSESEQAMDNYRIAMLDLYAQHHIVSLVIDKLGHVPVVDGNYLTLN